MKWFDCQSCGTEFRVVSDSTSTIEFCPFCGDSMEIETDDEDEDYDFDD
jgi:rRNA maturation endonuclease Nob1